MQSKRKHDAETSEPAAAGAGAESAAHRQGAKRLKVQAAEEKQQKAEPAFKNIFLKRIPLNEAWRLFIDGDEQAHGSTSLSEFLLPKKIIPLIAPELLQLKCSVFYAYLESDIEKNPAINPHIKNQLLLLRNKYKKIFMKTKPTFNHEMTFARAFVEDTKGWTAFENREKGYLRAMYVALTSTLATAKLSIEHILKLHKLATDNVANIDTDGSVGFRNSPKPQMAVVLSNFIDKTNSQELESFALALQRLFQKLKSGLWPTLAIHVTEYDDQANDDLTVFDQKNCNYSEFQKFFSKWQSSKDIFIELATTGQTQEETYKTINRLIKEFEDRCKTQLDFTGKLRCLAFLIQDLNQLHPFIDGNGRTFSMLLLNQLLLKMGLPPVFLKNPNDFENCDINGLVEKMITGMKNAFRLCLGFPIFNANTFELFKECSADEQQYFLECNDLLKEVFGEAHTQYYVADAKQTVAIDDIVKVMFELLKKQYLNESFLDEFINPQTREKAYEKAQAILHLQKAPAAAAAADFTPKPPSAS